MALDIFLAACLTLSSVHAGGFMVNPKPRSFDQYGRRSRLINSFPCGGPQYTTPNPKFRTRLVPILIQQNATSIDWFNTGVYVSGTLNFYLCTSLTATASSCYNIKSVTTTASTPLGPNTEQNIALPTAVVTGALCSSSCTLVMEWMMNKYETIYNCADVYVSTRDTYLKKPIQAAPLSRTNVKSGVPPNSCHLVNSKPNTKLAPVGDRCDAAWRSGQYRCGYGQCCTTFYEMNSAANPPRFCSPIYLDQNGTSQATYLPVGNTVLNNILSETVPGTVYDPEVAMFAACQNVPATYDYRFGTSDPDAKEVCNLCNLHDPAVCTSSYMFDYSEQTNMVPPSPVGPNTHEGNGSKTSEDTVPVVILIVIFALILVAIAVIAYVLFKNNGFGGQGYHSFSEETPGGVARIIRKTPQKKLPPGWKEYETDDGELYYYNEDDGTTQWEFPEV